MENKNQNEVNSTESIGLTEMQKTMKEIRKSQDKRFPIVMKNKDGLLEVIYENRVELYKLTSKDTFSKEDENKVDDSYAEIDMCSGCNMKRVRDTTDEDDWRFN